MSTELPAVVVGRARLERATSRRSSGRSPDNRSASARGSLSAAAVVGVQSGNCSATELPEHGRSGRESNPRPVASSGDNRIRSGPQHVRCPFVAVVECKRARGLEPQALRLSTEDNPLTPARDSRPTRNRTRTDEVGARHASRYTTGLSGRPASNRSLRSGAPTLSLTELRPREHARLESNQRPLPSQGSAHPLSYGRPRASGRSRTCAATVRRVRASVDTTEAESGDGGSRTRSSSVQARCSSP